MNKPKTIKIFLVDGHPLGFKIVELSNWNGKTMAVPRNRLKYFYGRQDSKKPSIYFLLKCEPEESGLYQVYIGEAEDIQERLTNHDYDKDFWQIVIVFSGDNLTKAHVKYLESRCLEIARNQKRCILENKNKPTRNYLAESDIAEMEEFLENIILLISALGYPILSLPTLVDELVVSEEDLLFCKGGGAEAKGRVVNGGFEVLKGSTVVTKTIPSFSDSSKKLRIFLIEEKVLTPHSDKLYVFTRNYIFNSPSAASDIVTGNSTSGRKRWKNAKGFTLEEIEK